MFQFFHKLVFYAFCLFQALDVLPDMPASSIEQRSGYYKSTSREDSQYLLEPDSCVC